MSLYHFTGLVHLPAITREGLTKGEVPLSMRDVKYGPRLSAPNLTRNADPAALHWENGFGLSKTTVRITVAIPPGDPKLVAYLTLCRKRGAPRRVLRTLDPHGQAKNWWVYHGTIPPAWFSEIAIHDGSGYVPLGSEELQNLIDRIEKEKENLVFFRNNGFEYVRLKDGVASSWLLDGKTDSVPTLEDAPHVKKGQLGLMWATSVVPGPTG
jgi:hypothetical protein